MNILLCVTDWKNAMSWHINIKYLTVIYFLSLLMITRSLNIMISFSILYNAVLFTYRTPASKPKPLRRKTKVRVSKWIKILLVTSIRCHLANYINRSEPIGLLIWAYWTCWEPSLHRKAGQECISYLVHLSDLWGKGRKKTDQDRTTHTDYNSKHMTKTLCKDCKL